MDELDSNFLSCIFHDQSEQFYQLLNVESQLQHREQTLIETRHEDQNPQELDSQDTNKRRRDSNTIFKTPLSVFRKILKEMLKSNKQCIDILGQINQKKNASTFMKFLVLSDHLGIKNQIKEPFLSQMQKILPKKKTKIPKQRFQELQKIYQQMKSTLDCDRISDAVQQYWGRYRQRSKFEASKKQIMNFQKYLETTQIKLAKNQKK